MRCRFESILILIFVGVLLVSCAVPSGKPGAVKPSMGGSDGISIAIVDFADIPSHRNCMDGIIKGLESRGFKEGDSFSISYRDAGTDIRKLDKLVRKAVESGPDLICAITTPAAVSAYEACKDKDIPVVYAAVSDPIAAGLSDESGNPPGEITGTSDELPVDHQLQMIRDILPDAKKIGIIYTTTEVNSSSTLETYRNSAGDYGFKIKDKGVKNKKAAKRAAKKLAKKVDCICNLTDNTVITVLKSELKAARKAGIPVFGSEMEQVREGCIACEGVDYKEIGIETGNIISEILKGNKKASDIKFKVFSGAELFLNEEAADRLGITFNDNVRGAATEIFRGIK